MYNIVKDEQKTTECLEKEAKKVESKSDGEQLEGRVETPGASHDLNTA